MSLIRSLPTHIQRHHHNLPSCRTTRPKNQYQLYDTHSVSAVGSVCSAHHIPLSDVSTDIMSDNHSSPRRASQDDEGNEPGSPSSRISRTPSPDRNMYSNKESFKVNNGLHVGGEENDWIDSEEAMRGFDTEAANTEAANTEAVSTEAVSTEAVSTEASSTEASSTKKPAVDTNSSGMEGNKESEEALRAFSTVAFSTNKPAIDMDFSQFTVPIVRPEPKPGVEQLVESLLNPPPHAFVHGTLSIQWVIGVLGLIHFSFHKRTERYVLRKGSPIRKRGAELGIPTLYLEWLCGDNEELSATEQGLYLTPEFFRELE